jgi:hypothetical protein
MAGAVQKQVVLPWSQVIKISLNSVRARFFRSMITMLTLSLAVAFVAYTYSSYSILNALWPHVDPSLQERILNSGYEHNQGVFGSSPKDQWLILLSLTVCVVGILNAQLMAVTERFREIGTFKCLGALNSFVVRIFVLEAVYQGILGGISGSLAGVLFSTVSLLIKLGWPVLLWWPTGEMAIRILSVTGLAVILSLIGVVYPALVAAKMQPAVALRSEE